MKKEPRMDSNLHECDFLRKLLDGAGVEWKALGKISKIETGKLNANAADDEGDYMFFTTARILEATKSLTLSQVFMRQ